MVMPEIWVGEREVDRMPKIWVDKLMRLVLLNSNGDQIVVLGTLLSSDYVKDKLIAFDYSADWAEWDRNGAFVRIKEEGE